MAVAACCLLTSGVALSQSKEKVMADILKKNETYKTITSGCTQVKTMKGMKKNVEEGNEGSIRAFTPTVARESRKGIS